MDVHCFSHRLELAVRDAFLGSYYTQLFTVFRQHYCMHNNTPKRLRELVALASAVESHVVKLGAARYCKGYPAVVRHAGCTPGVDIHGPKGLLLTMLTIFKFVYLVLWVDLFLPLTKLSLAWQKDATEIPQMFTGERATKATPQRRHDENERHSVVNAGEDGCNWSSII